MARQCYVCKKYSCREKGLSFHRFPRSPTLTKQWFSLLGFDENKKLPRSALICMGHFTENDFHTHPSGMRALRPNAVPLPFHPERTASQSSSDSTETTDTADKFSTEETETATEGEETCDVSYSPLGKRFTDDIKIEPVELAPSDIVEDVKMCSDLAGTVKIKKEADESTSWDTVQDVALENSIVTDLMKTVIPSVIPQESPTPKSPYVIVVTPHGDSNSNLSSATLNATIPAQAPAAAKPPPSLLRAPVTPELRCVSAAVILRTGTSNQSTVIPVVATITAGPNPQILSVSQVRPNPSSRIESGTNQNLATVPDPLAPVSASAVASPLRPSDHAANIANVDFTRTGPQQHLFRSISTQTDWGKPAQPLRGRSFMENQEDLDLGNQAALNQISRSKFTRPKPRYPGDIVVSDQLCTTEDAKRAMLICKESVQKKNKQIRTEQQRRRRLKAKIRELLQVITTFKDNSLVPEDIAETLGHGLSQLLTHSSLSNDV